jgi:hypothetical protein
MAAWVFETGVMSNQAESADFLSRAIGEFREELLLWIDTELARLQEREQEENLVVEEVSTAPKSIRSGPRGGSHLGSQTNCDGASPGRPDFLSGMERPTLRNCERFTDRNSRDEITGLPVAFTEPETDPEPQAPPLNPRQRLDALARLLDHRLKQVEGAAGTCSGVPSGRSKGMQDESLSHSGRRGVESSSDAD